MTSTHLVSNKNATGSYERNHKLGTQIVCISYKTYLHSKKVSNDWKILLSSHSTI